MSTRLPSRTGAPPSNSDIPTASRRPAGAGRLRDGQVSRDGRFRWSAGWRQWVPLRKGAQEIDLPGPLECGPLEPEILAHDSFCSCPRCLNAGIRYADYLKAKKIRETNGF